MSQQLINTLDECSILVNTSASLALSVIGDVYQAHESLRPYLMYYGAVVQSGHQVIMPPGIANAILGHPTVAAIAFMRMVGGTGGSSTMSTTALKALMAKINMPDITIAWAAYRHFASHWLPALNSLDGPAEGIKPVYQGFKNSLERGGAS